MGYGGKGNWGRGGGGEEGVGKDKGSEALKERCRKESGSSCGEFKEWLGKREREREREREEEDVGTMEREGRGGFKRSGKTEMSPVKGGQRVGGAGGGCGRSDGVSKGDKGDERGDEE